MSKVCSNIIEAHTQLNCAICLNNYTTPYMLQCGHSFCLICLGCYQIWDGNKKCPVCREVIKNAYPNYALMNEDNYETDEQLTEIKEKINEWQNRDKSEELDNLLEELREEQERCHTKEILLNQYINQMLQLNQNTQQILEQVAKQYYSMVNTSFYTGFDLCLLLHTRNINVHLWGCTKKQIETWIKNNYNNEFLNQLECLNEQEIYNSYSEWVQYHSLITENNIKYYDFPTLKRIYHSKTQSSINSKDKAIKYLLGKELSLQDIILKNI